MQLFVLSKGSLERVCFKYEEMYKALAELPYGGDELRELRAFIQWDLVHLWDCLKDNKAEMIRILAVYDTGK